MLFFVSSFAFNYFCLFCLLLRLSGGNDVGILCMRMVVQSISISKYTLTDTAIQTTDTHIAFVHFTSSFISHSILLAIWENTLDVVELIAGVKGHVTTTTNLAYDHLYTKQTICPQSVQRKRENAALAMKTMLNSYDRTTSAVRAFTY